MEDSGTSLGYWKNPIWKDGSEEYSQNLPTPTTVTGGNC